MIFIQGVNFDFNLQEDLLSVKTMHETTGDEDLFEKLLLAMRKFDLPFEKLSRFTTDSAPVMAGSQKGLTALVEKEMTRCCLAADNLVVRHCIIHPQKLCAKLL